MIEYVKFAALIFALDAITSLIGFAKEADRPHYPEREQRLVIKFISLVCNAGVAVWGLHLVMTAAQ